MKKKTNGAC